MGPGSEAGSEQVGSCSSRKIAEIRVKLEH